MTNEILYTMNWVKTVLLDLLKLYILSFILLALFYRLLLFFFLYSTCCLCPLCLAILTFSLPWSLLFMCVSVWPAMGTLFFTCWNWGKCSYPTSALYNSWGFGLELWPTSWGPCGTSSGLRFEVLLPSSRIEDQSYRWKARLQVCKSCLKRLP